MPLAFRNNFTFCLVTHQSFYTCNHRSCDSAVFNTCYQRPCDSAFLTRAIIGHVTQHFLTRAIIGHVTQQFFNTCHHMWRDSALFNSCYHRFGWDSVGGWTRGAYGQQHLQQHPQRHLGQLAEHHGAVLLDLPFPDLIECPQHLAAACNTVPGTLNSCVPKAVLRMQLLL